MSRPVQPTAHTSFEDLSWKAPIRAVLMGLVVPWWIAWLARRIRADAGLTGLTQVRLLWLAFVNAILLIGIVVAVMVPAMDTNDDLVLPAAAVVVTYGVASFLLPRTLERPLDCSSNEALMSGYRVRFFLGLAFAEFAALLGFVGFVITGTWWLYLLGAAITLAGFARLAPTAERLAAIDRELLARGCTRSLREALAATERSPGSGGTT